ncbi:MAG: hypothetical protein V4581_10085 [Bacteroidota bacterium]
MRYFTSFLACISCFLMLSCSLKNVSNDFRWKNQKFKESYSLGFEYTPQITIEIPKIDEPWFYDSADTVNADRKYRVEELLQKKFSKRNMVFNESSEVRLRIEKLLFKEYLESVTVNDESGSIGESSKDYFIFEISGSLIRNDSVIASVSAEHKYNNEPQESDIFDGVIVMGGGNARADKMIENTINEFTYRVYQAITKPETRVAKL